MIPSNEFILFDEETGVSLVVMTATPSQQLQILPGNILFQPVKNVYYKLVITQVFAPLLSTYVVEVRLDGVLIHKEFNNDAQELTTVKVYASKGTNNLLDGITLRNYYFDSF